MSALPEHVAFHLGIVVRDLAAATEPYRRMLGADVWQTRSMGRDGRSRMAYGRGAGVTFELFQLQPGGSSMLHEFMAKHGEGLQHIGFWTTEKRRPPDAGLG